MFSSIESLPLFEDIFLEFPKWELVPLEPSLVGTRGPIPGLKCRSVRRE
jgi:hypothetical protein